MKTVLIVEPDYMLGDSYEKALMANFNVYVARNAQAAIDVIDNNKIDLVITDTQISENNGIEILYEIRSYDDWLELPMIMLSSIPESDFPISSKDWQKYGIAAFVYKPKTQPLNLVNLVEQTLS